MKPRLSHRRRQLQTYQWRSRPTLYSRTHPFLCRFCGVTLPHLRLVHAFKLWPADMRHHTLYAAGDRMEVAWTDFCPGCGGGHVVNSQSGQPFTLGHQPPEGV